MAILRIAPQLTPTGYRKVIRESFTRAGEGWRGALAHYPPQKYSAGHAVTLIGKRGQPLKRKGWVGYERTKNLAKTAGYRLEVNRVGLGGISYTPYVIFPRKSGVTIWPGKADEAFTAAETAFKTTFVRTMTGG